MAKLRHLALYTEDPEATAAFYKDAFEMFEVGRTDSSIAEGIYLSDGTLNVAVLHYRSKEGAAKFGSSSKYGLSHFGFWVDDMETARERLKELGAQHVEDRDRASNTTGYFEEKWKGPDGTVIDITDSGWAGALRRCL